MKTLYYLKRGVSLPPQVVIKKIIHRIRNNYKRNRKRIRDQRFSTYESKYWCSHLNRFVSKVDLSQLPREETLQLNAHSIQHEFDLLGSGWIRVSQGMKCHGIDGFVYPPTSFSPLNQANRKEALFIRSLIYEPYQPIDWHIDFKSGYRWKESTWSQDIQYGDKLGVDVKVPWELARMQHLCSLAWGYALEADENYLIEFRNQILDFIASNPPRYGVNWVCTMDVGIRIANWLLAYDLFLAYDAKFDEEFERVFFRSIYEHAKHIFHHLEWDPHLRSNHYLANIVGLLFASSYLPKNLELQNSFNFSVSELKKEVLQQFHPDGSNFESSTSYHRLSAEMVIFGAVIAREKGIEFSREFLDRIEKMGDFIRDITKPDGKIVQFGDNDSGRFIKVFPEKEGLDHRYLIRPTRRLSSLTSLINDLNISLDEEHSIKAQYSDFGVYILNKKPWYLAIRCGSIGQKGNGGHAHNDQLSFELALKRISIFVDPGTYVYTPLPDQRRRFRSSAMHNTLVIAGEEQNQDEGLFRMKDRANAKVVYFDRERFVGEHRGFGSKYQRELEVSEKFCRGKEVFQGVQKKVYFHLAPNWSIQSVDMGRVICQHESISVELNSREGIWDFEEYEYSRAYGVKEKAFAIVLSSDLPSVCWEVQLLS